MQNANSRFLINEMYLIQKAVTIHKLSDLAIKELINKCSKQLRAVYFWNIVKGDWIKPLGYLNSVINAIYYSIKRDRRAERRIV